MDYQTEKELKPEEKARLLIDAKLKEAGWDVIDRKQWAAGMNAVAVRESLLKGNLEADYMLFLAGKAVAVIEAKHAGISVLDPAVAEQAATYTKSMQSWCPYWEKPLQLTYLSNGLDIAFLDGHELDADYIKVNKFHSPKKIKEIVGIEDEFAGLPTLFKDGLRDCQFEAITNLEKSFKSGKKRALISLATGSGKTYTACLAVYRFLNYTPMRRVLFLVDRNNLGKQALNEFSTFRRTESGNPFTTEFAAERLTASKEPSGEVIISTIQRLFSVLNGNTEDASEEQEDAGVILDDETVELPPNPKLPPDFFDLIIVDECHRSIYGSWRAVLDYFTSARLIGLTATPVPETLAFFDKNTVVDYTLEDSIADGVNVPCRIYRIKTELSEKGGTIQKGQHVQVTKKYTAETTEEKKDSEKQFTGKDINRSVVAPDQIRKILEEYRDTVYETMYSDREPDIQFLPKTLIFALNEDHARRIVEITKDVFGQKNNAKFVQQITYSAGDSDALIRSFRNDKEFRIAVTVTLVATGTDVPSLEVLVFMRDVASEPLYIQMKGRGVRTISDDKLRNITPNATSKELFYLVDAVGVTEHSKITVSPTTGPLTKIPTLKELLERISYGDLPDDNLQLLANKISRINSKTESKYLEEFASITGCALHELARTIFKTLPKLPAYQDVNQPNTERKQLVACLAEKPEAREKLLEMQAGYVDIIDTEDTVIGVGFSTEEAVKSTAAFEAYVNTHKDEIEALRLIYNHDGTPLTYALLQRLYNHLTKNLANFSIPRMWKDYALISPENVTQLKDKNERVALTNIIQLVRFAFKRVDKLVSMVSGTGRYFALWQHQMQRNITEEQVALMKEIVAYIATNGSCSIQEIIEFDKPLAGQLIKAYAGKDAANEAIQSLSRFIIYGRKAA